MYKSKGKQLISHLLQLHEIGIPQGKEKGIEPLRPNFTGGRRKRKSSWIGMTREARHAESNDKIDVILEQGELIR